MQVTVAVNSAPLASTAVIVTTTPVFSVGNVSVTFVGDEVTVAVPGVTPINDDDNAYGVTPPLMVNTTLRSLHWVAATAATAGRAATPPEYTGCGQLVAVVV